MNQEGGYPQYTKNAIEKEFHTIYKTSYLQVLPWSSPPRHSYIGTYLICNQHAEPSVCMYKYMYHVHLSPMITPPPFQKKRKHNAELRRRLLIPFLHLLLQT